MPERRGKTFGQVICEARRRAGYSMKYVADMIKKEDGESISQQYLSDLEKDRRNPPADEMIEQFARLFNISREFLYLTARRLPAELDSPANEDQAKTIYKAYREAIENHLAA